MKPIEWSSFDLPDGARKLFFVGHLEGGGSFNCDYSIRGRDKWINSFLESKYMNTDRDKGQITIRSHRPNSIFERGRWVHLAFVWGPRADAAYYPRYTEYGHNVSTLRIYVNGRYFPGAGSRNSGQNSTPSGLLKFLLFDWGAGIAIDELRISDIQRYRNDFTPPSQDQELTADAHTRVLYHFNGNTEPESPAAQGKPSVP
jgi:hypothetical protein